MKVLTERQTVAINRALGRQGKALPRMPGGCVALRKTGKSPGFAKLPRGVVVDVCRARSGDIYITGRTSKGVFAGALGRARKTRKPRRK